MDPRLSIIDKRLIGIKRLIAISGGKGGIGKSSVAATLALTLSKSGFKVGLLDLDFCGPSTHIILGIRGIYPKEEKGIIPPEIYGIKFMSIIYYAGDNPSPLRGIDISNAIIELLAITRWGSLDFLIIDMPPGIGDTTLDTIRLIKKTEFLIITTQSKMALETVKKVLKMLKELGVPIVGVIENMKVRESSFVMEQIKTFNVSYLGTIDFDENLEDSIGDVNRLLETNFAQNIREIVSTKIGNLTP
ncbi:P-loop NTPase [candidate division KSB1 bacterium]|nr:P-loop NTPase [candidate division KSB1 bacterium]